MVLNHGLKIRDTNAAQITFEYAVDTVIIARVYVLFVRKKDIDFSMLKSDARTKRLSSPKLNFLP